jgi:hypothetical protein
LLFGLFKETKGQAISAPKQWLWNSPEHYTIPSDSLNNITRLLCDEDMVSFNGFLLPKRKKAFLRYVKNIAEPLEWYARTGKKPDTDCWNKWYALHLMYYSFLQKSMEQKPKFREFVSWKRTGRKSEKGIRFPIINDGKPAILRDSIYYGRFSKGAPMHRFKRLAKSKKIRAAENMVVLFRGIPSGSSAPKIDALDLDLDNEWCVKWGDEVHSDIAGSRIFAALGYDVDHVYHYAKNKLTLVFDDYAPLKTTAAFIKALNHAFSFSIQPWISEEGIISEKMVEDDTLLKPFIGREYLRFKECALEARPDRVKRLGSILPNHLGNAERVELRGALLAHAFIGNWDTREENTTLTLVHHGNYQYSLSACFTDLGTSFGVSISTLHRDFKTALVNDYSWEFVEQKNGNIYLCQKMNTLLDPYQLANYSDLKWMAEKIAQLDSACLWQCVEKAGWPNPVAQLYFHKLASRREGILKAFSIVDPNPIPFHKDLNIRIQDEIIIRNGVLCAPIEPQNHPENLTSTKGRFRNYGH